MYIFEIIYTYATQVLKRLHKGHLNMRTRLQATQLSIGFVDAKNFPNDENTDEVLRCQQMIVYYLIQGGFCHCTMKY